jgi:23S rRNA (guanosine2251-2'-O)-methyltransferase
VRIPLRGATPSLNASVATALLLYEIARRGWMRGLSGTAPAPRIVRPALPTPAPAEPVAQFEPELEHEAELQVELQPEAELQSPQPEADLPTSEPEAAEAEEAPWHAVVAAPDANELDSDEPDSDELEVEAELASEPDSEPEPEPSGQADPSLTPPVSLQLPSFSSSGFEGDIRL